MSTITLTSSKSYEQILALPMDIYVRRSDAEYLDDTHDKSFVNLGYTSRGSTVVNISPVIADTEGGEHAILYNVKVRTVLAQAHADILTILKNLKTRENVDVLYYHEAFSESNFIQRNMSLYVDGDIDISASKNRGIPVTFTGQFSNIDDIFKPSLQTINIPLEYFVYRNSILFNSMNPFTGADLNDFKISTNVGVRSGYLDDSSDNSSQLGFSLQSSAFIISAEIVITSLSGREIGFALNHNNTFGSMYLVHNGKVNIYSSKTNVAPSLKTSFNLIHNTATESFTLSMKVTGTTVDIYDNTTLIGSYTLTNPNSYGYYVGLAIKDNDGNGSESNTLGNFNYQSDLFLPEYLMADEYEHYTEVDYVDLITPP